VSLPRSVSDLIWERSFAESWAGQQYGEACWSTWPPSRDDVLPVSCELLTRHGTDHWHWTGGVDVTWPRTSADS
jgi:hypothetical protein